MIDVRDHLEPADLLFIVPPTALPDQPSMAAHLLQACARRAGLRVHVHYANWFLAQELGEDYRLIAQGSYSLVGERVFARAAFGLPPLGRWAEKTFDWATLFETQDFGNRNLPFVAHPEFNPPTLAKLFELEARVFDWVERWTTLLAEAGYPAYACTTSYEQNNASFALLGGVKRRLPDVLSLLGGANAEGELAEGLASLDPQGRAVDVIFSGETEKEFVSVLLDWKKGKRPSSRIVRGALCLDLDSLPRPVFDDHRSLAPDAPVDLPYETSRGCWWGEKSACLFCAFKTEKLRYRHVSPDRVFDDWAELARSYPGLRIGTTDLVMPPAYTTTLLPRLAQADLPLRVYWEQRTNLDWPTLKLLKAAKVLEIQPGIETFSLRLLEKIRKGNRPSRSLNILRWASILGIRVYWNLLWGIPGETLADYEPIFELFRLIPHLPPPFGLSQLLILRDSAYQREPRSWGVETLKPVASFGAVYPEGANVEKLATFFHPEYEAETLKDAEFAQRLTRVFHEWQETSQGTDNRRALFLLKQAEDAYLLLDTRRLEGASAMTQVDRKKARVLLASEPFIRSELQNWAVENRLAVVLDGDYVPLALSTPEVMEELVFGKAQAPTPGC